MTEKKLDLSKPVYTRGDKEEWIVLCGDSNTITNSNWQFSLIAVKKSTGEIGRWRPDGRIGTAFGSPDDLINMPPNVPPRHTGYINVYENEFGLFVSGPFQSSGVARAAGGSSRITCVRIEFEEGQFDE